MVEAVGRSSAPRTVVAATEPPGRSARAGATVTTTERQAPATANLARVAKDLAATRPVDSARVEALRAEIVSGEYRADPVKIAERMLALEAGSKGA